MVCFLNFLCQFIIYLISKRLKLTTLSIIIVNYKTASLVIDCIQSIKKWTKTVDFEIIVVDNCPEDSGKSIVTKVFPEVKWVQMDYNAGFARANNVGIKTATGKVVLLLNSDTIIEEDAVQLSYKAFADSKYVACGVQLLYEDKTPQISGNYFMKGSLNNLLPLPYVGGILKWIGTQMKVAAPHVPNAGDAIEVDWINGAFLMVKREAFEQAGLLDEDFFLYAEEAEWCYRLSKLGKLCIYGQFKVIHLQGKTANQAFGVVTEGYYDLYSKKGLQIMLSNFLRIRKQYGVGWLLFHYFFFIATIPFAYLISLFDNLFKGKNPFYSYPSISMFAANVGKLLGFLPKLITNKSYFYKVL